MGKCKNCGENTENNKIYCSLKCRNIYVNNRRDYSKMKKTLDEKHLYFVEEYYKNPKKCNFCDKIIEFDDRRKSYCNSSCSAKFNNKNKKGIKYSLSENGRIALVASAVKNLNSPDRPRSDKYDELKIEYYKEPNKCINCNSILEFKNRNKIYCCNDCRSDYFSKLKADLDLYKLCSKFKFNLSEYENEFDFNLIKEFGWYQAKNRGNNINGVSRDHMFSINEGFKRLINPLLIAHPANCILIQNINNQKKQSKCSITLNELLENINNFEKIYGKYYDYELNIHIKLDDLKEIYNNNSYKK